MVKCERQLRVSIAHRVGSVDSSSGVGGDTGASAVVETTDGAEEVGGFIT